MESVQTRSSLSKWVVAFGWIANILWMLMLLGARNGLVPQAESLAYVALALILTSPIIFLIGLLSFGVEAGRWVWFSGLTGLGSWVLFLVWAISSAQAGTISYPAIH